MEQIPGTQLLVEARKGELKLVFRCINCIEQGQPSDIHVWDNAQAEPARFLLYGLVTDHNDELHSSSDSDQGGH